MCESALGKASSDSNAADKEFSCPTCGDVFDTRNGMHVHHYQKHGESIAKTEITCGHCGTTDKRYKSNVRQAQDHVFCSTECHDEWRRENMESADFEMYKESFVDCSYCGDRTEVQPVKLETQDNWFCDQRCYGAWLSENNYGKNHHQYKPDKKNKRLYQTVEWQRLRERVFERDDYECQYCGTDEQLRGHHIIPINDGGAKLDIDNVVTLCVSCHQVCEGWFLRPDTSSRPR